MLLRLSTVVRTLRNEFVECKHDYPSECFLPPVGFVPERGIGGSLTGALDKYETRLQEIRLY